jgi:hypothetical protein
VAGNTADDPLYLPAIAKVRRSVGLVAYPRPADIVSRPLPFHLHPMDQPVMSPPNQFATPRLPLLTYI